MHEFLYAKNENPTFKQAGKAAKWKENLNKLLHSDALNVDRLKSGTMSSFLKLLQSCI